MRNARWFSILMTITVLLSSCMSADASASLDSDVVPVLNPETKNVSLANEPVDIELGETQVESECLNCHADKQRLIDTAKEEEVVEAESSGVG